MSNLRDKLGMLLREQIFKDLEFEDGTEFLRIDEPQNQENQKNSGKKKRRNVQGKLKEFKITEMPDSFAAIILDHNNLKDKPNLTINDNFSWLIVDNHSGKDRYSSAGRKCDIVIVASCNDVFYVLAVELKSKKYDVYEVNNKFINSY